MKTRSHHQSGFGTLTLIGIVVALLLVTGIGQAMWRHSTQLGAYCRDIMLELNFSAGMDTCNAIGQKIVSFQRHLEGKVGSSSFGTTMNLEEFSGHLARQFSQAAIGYNSPQLSGLIDPTLLQKPSFDFSGASSLDKLRMSLTQGAQGQALMQQGNSAQGLKYLQSSASMGDVGLLSQLQLGSTLSQGGNTSHSKHYYGQALQSIESLQKSNTPQSKQLLGALPLPAPQMKNQLQSIM
jgi:hypothetical protein